MIYGSISRGFKGGGFSVAALQALVGEAARVVNPEFLTTVEIGAKTTWDEGRVQLNGAVFWNDWEDQQMFAVIPSPGGLLPLLINVPESELVGAEVELSWLPADGWLVTGGLGILDTEVKDAGTLAFVSVGNVLPNAADFSYNLLVRKDIELATGSLTLQADYAYMDDLQYDIENKPEFVEDGYGLLNARANYNFGTEERFQISLWGKNLTDEEYCTTRTDLRGVSDNILCVTNEALPLYGVSFTANF